MWVPIASSLILSPSSISLHMSSLGQHQLPFSWFLEFESWSWYLSSTWLDQPKSSTTILFWWLNGRKAFPQFINYNHFAFLIVLPNENRAPLFGCIKSWMLCYSLSWVPHSSNQVTNQLVKKGAMHLASLKCAIFLSFCILSSIEVWLLFNFFVHPWRIVSPSCTCLSFFTQPIIWTIVFVFLMISKEKIYINKKSYKVNRLYTKDNKRHSQEEGKEKILIPLSFRSHPIHKIN